MAKKKISKKKNTKKTESTENVSENKTKTYSQVSLHDNSFVFCISNITGIPTDIFDNIDYIIKNVGIENWYQSYLKVLKHHSYDMIFFSYQQTPLEVNEEKTIEKYQFTNLPTGKCIILGSDSNGSFRCMVGLMQNERLTVVYDPHPTQDISEIVQIGFFISTFVKPEVEVADSNKAANDEI